MNGEDNTVRGLKRLEEDRVREVEAAAPADAARSRVSEQER